MSESIFLSPESLPWFVAMLYGGFPEAESDVSVAVRRIWSTQLCREPCGWQRCTERTFSASDFSHGLHGAMNICQKATM